ncbi:hypothetical protein ABIA30_002499 [Mycobacterium sp. MAA66]|uniref:hypothetical protein n=1 Tax=Mycobacterium sp. MAA66 TaxID=3156297 RepID=UPI003512E336
MKIVPAVLEQHINRFDRQQSRIIAISSGLLALWSAYRVAWALYLSVAYDFLFGTLVIQVAIWGVIGAVAAISAFAFYTHSTKAPGSPERTESQ